MRQLSPFRHPQRLITPGSQIDIGVVALVLSAWIRYAGTSRSLSTSGAYTFLILGQVCKLTSDRVFVDFHTQFFASIATPVFQVLGPKYSETWFGLKGRTTATMVMAISSSLRLNFPPAFSYLFRRLSCWGCDRTITITPGWQHKTVCSYFYLSSRYDHQFRPTVQILVLGIISTVVFPALFLIGEAPPTPPSQSSVSNLSCTCANNNIGSVRGFSKASFPLLPCPCYAWQGRSTWCTYDLP